MKSESAKEWLMDMTLLLGGAALLGAATFILGLNEACAQVVHPAPAGGASARVAGPVGPSGRTVSAPPSASRDDWRNAGNYRRGNIQPEKRHEEPRFRDNFDRSAEHGRSQTDQPKREPVDWRNRGSVGDRFEPKSADRRDARRPDQRDSEFQRRNRQSVDWSHDHNSGRGEQLGRNGRDDHRGFDTRQFWNRNMGPQRSALSPGWAYRGLAPHGYGPTVLVAPTYGGWAVAAGNVIVVPGRVIPTYSGWAYPVRR